MNYLIISHLYWYIGKILQKTIESYINQIKY